VTRSALNAMTFYQTGCGVFYEGYWISLIRVEGLLFFPHKRPKKRSKRTPLVKNGNYHSAIENSGSDGYLVMIRCSCRDYARQTMTGKRQTLPQKHFIFRALVFSDALLHDRENTDLWKKRTAIRD
jgi:hypothetical protein